MVTQTRLSVSYLRQQYLSTGIDTAVVSMTLLHTLYLR